MNLHEPGLLVMDMDSTLIQIECIDELAELAGRKAEVTKVTAAAMNGELDFETSLRTRVSLLKGIPTDMFSQLFTPIPWQPHIPEFIRWIQQLGWRTAVVSGGFTWFTDQVQQALKLDAAMANQLQISNGLVTGELCGAIVDAAAKAQQLRKLAEQYGLPLSQTIAIGDGANDIPLLQASAVSIAVGHHQALWPYADKVFLEPNFAHVQHYLAQNYGS